MLFVVPYEYRRDIRRPPLPTNRTVDVTGAFHAGKVTLASVVSVATAAKYGPAYGPIPDVIAGPSADPNVPRMDPTDSRARRRRLVSTDPPGDPDLVSAAGFVCPGGLSADPADGSA